MSDNISKVILELDNDDINLVAEDYLGKKLSNTQWQEVLTRLYKTTELPRDDIECAIDYVLKERIWKEHAPIVTDTVF